MTNADSPAPPPDGDPARTLVLRLRADLRAAMLARQSLATATIRALIAAIDDAQAIPVAADRDPMLIRRVGDSSVEVPRRRLSAAELQALLRREAQAREEAAAEMAILGQAERVDRLRGEAAIISAYL